MCVPSPRSPRHTVGVNEFAVGLRWVGGVSGANTHRFLPSLHVVTFYFSTEVSSADSHFPSFFISSSSCHLHPLSPSCLCSCHSNIRPPSITFPPLTWIPVFVLFHPSSCPPSLCLSFSPWGAVIGQRVGGWSFAGLSHLPPPPAAIHLHKQASALQPYSLTTEWKCRVALQHSGLSVRRMKEM